MATGSGEVPVVPEAAEGKGEGEGKVAAAVEEKEGEVSAEAVTVEKEREGAVVSEVVEKAPAKAGMITLKCNDGKLIEMRAASAMLSKILGEMVESGCADGVIPLTEIDSKALKKVIEYCDKHADFAANKKSGTDEEKGWDKGFIDELDKNRNLLFSVIMAANFLCIDGLLKDTFVVTIKGKTPQEIRKAFNIDNNDITDEELEEIIQQCNRVYGQY
ncbi:SKP1-like protein 1A [Oryza brachyantha]|uniref:SKP1-like protein n=1 Tax=Oryza brachyantha TaxID=4533 RepID=J3MN55_ORYBR|nr:SKP1-like protein 1A [Oryza brachyantha]